MSADPKHIVDVDALVRGLGSPEPELAPPPWPEEAPGAWERARTFLAANPIAWAPAFATAIALVLIALPGGEQSPPSEGLRGVDEVSAAHFSLDLLVQQDGQTHRLGELEQVRVGDRVFFRVAARTKTEAYVWVQTPDGVEVIRALEVSTQTADLRSANGLIAYRFEQPGIYAFYASPEAKRCAPPACAEQIVEVK